MKKDMKTFLIKTGRVKSVPTRYTSKRGTHEILIRTTWLKILKKNI